MTKTPDKMTPAELRAYADQLERKAVQDEIGQSLEGRMAVLLHDNLCRYNHTDGCPFGYESNSAEPWNCAEHVRWRNKARELLKAGGYDKYLWEMK